MPKNSHEIPPLPKEFREHMLRQFADGSALLNAIENGTPEIGLRVNPLKKREVPWRTSPVPWEPEGHVLEETSKRPGLHPLHAAGAFYMQEPSAMCAAPLLGVQPGMRVLDLCAAPGGKTGQLAAALRGEGVLIANEIDPARAQILSSNLERLGYTNTVLLSEHPQRLAERFGGAFDAVLVDAPCSGEGMFRKEPQSRLSWSPEAPASCARRQAAILSCAARLVRPGGTLVYSTCTFNREENEGAIESFLREQREFTCLETHRIFPHLHRGEGHFAAKLIKADGKQAEWIPCEEEEFLRGSRLYHLPNDCPELRGLRVVRAGIEIAENKKDRQEPSHGLAMAADWDDSIVEWGWKRALGEKPPLIELSFDEAQEYLRGESIFMADAPKGWLLCAYDGLPLGLGKCSDGQIKNRLPKGLRIHTTRL